MINLFLCITQVILYNFYSSFIRNLSQFSIFSLDFVACTLFSLQQTSNRWFTFYLHLKLDYTSENYKTLIVHQVVVYYFPSLAAMDIRVHMALLTVPLIFLCWIGQLKYLSPVSFTANILQSSSLVLLFYYLFQDLPDVSTRPAFGSWKTLPL